jgi:hypothetical protein
MSQRLPLSLSLLLLSACVVEAEPELGETSAGAIVLPGEILTDQAGVPRSLVADASHLYWIDTETERLQRMAKTGGAIQTLATGAQAMTPWAIAVDASHVYWLDTGEGAVRRTPRGGGATVTLATGQGDLLGLAVDTSYVYFSGSTAAGGRVRRVAKWGGAAQTIATASFPSALATDGFFVYVADAHVLAGSNRILRVPRGGGVVTVLSSDEDALGLAIDGSSVFWKRFWTGDVRRASKWMPGATTIAADGGGWGDLDLDAADVWWTTGPLLHRAPKAGGGGEVVFETADWANSLALDAAAVYLAVDDGTIVAVDK